MELTVAATAASRGERGRSHVGGLDLTITTADMTTLKAAVAVEDQRPYTDNSLSGHDVTSVKLPLVLYCLSLLISRFYAILSTFIY